MTSTKKPELPTLPGPCNATFYPNGATYLHKLGPGVAYFTAEQMREYALAAIEMRRTETAALRTAVMRLLNCMELAGWEGGDDAEFARAALAAQGEQG